MLYDSMKDIIDSTVDDLLKPGECGISRRYRYEDRDAFIEWLLVIDSSIVIHSGVSETSQLRFTRGKQWDVSDFQRICIDEGRLIEYIPRNDRWHIVPKFIDTQCDVTEANKTVEVEIANEHTEGITMSEMINMRLPTAVSVVPKSVSVLAIQLTQQNVDEVRRFVRFFTDNSGLEAGQRWVAREEGLCHMIGAQIMRQVEYGDWVVSNSTGYTVMSETEFNKTFTVTTL